MRRKIMAAVMRVLAFLLGGAAAVTPAIGFALVLLPEFHKVLPHIDWRALLLVAFVLGWLLLWFVVGLGVALLLGQRLPRLRCVTWFWCGALSGSTAGIALLPIHRPEFAVGSAFACGVIAGLLSIRAQVRERLNDDRTAWGRRDGNCAMSDDATQDAEPRPISGVTVSPCATSHRSLWHCWWRQLARKRRHRDQSIQR